MKNIIRSKETAHERVQRMKALGGAAATKYGQKKGKKSGKKRPGLIARLGKVLSPRVALLEKLKSRRKANSIAAAAVEAKRKKSSMMRVKRRQAERG